MQVLVTGASGFVGRAVIDTLLESGRTVRAAYRTAPAALPPGVDAIMVGDLGPGTDWSAAVRGIDVVVHLAARVHVMQDSATEPLDAFRRVNVQGTAALANAAAREGVRRFVYVSSVKVNGERTGDDPFRETDAPRPADPYGVSKREAEDLLRNAAAASGMEVVIVRPPLVYGPGVRANFLRLLEAVARRLPLPLGGVRNGRTLVYVRNLASLLDVCVDHPAAAGETFLVCDGHAVSSPELVRAIAYALGVRPVLLPVPAWVLRGAGRLTGRGAAVDRLLGSLVVDASHARGVLGWEPPFSLADGLADTARWFRSTGNGRAA